MANGVQKVSLTKSRTTINKQWVVGLGWGFGNSKSGRVGESVGSPGDEVVKVVFRVQSGVKKDANSTGFTRVFLALKRRGRSDRIDVFRGLGNRWICLDIRVDHHGKVGGPSHQGVFLQDLENIATNSLLEHASG